MSLEKPKQYNLENWMGDMPEFARNYPFIYLAIPGNYCKFFNKLLKLLFQVHMIACPIR